MPEFLELLLKPVQGEREVPSIHILKEEYATRLLETYGANNTGQLREMITKELPIEKALVEPVWARGSMIIFPGCKNYRESDKKELVDSLYAPKSPSAHGKVRIQVPAPAAGKPAATSAARHKKKTSEEAGPKTQQGRRVSWSTVHTLDVAAAADQLLSQKDLAHPLFRELLRPPTFAQGDIERSASLFCANLADYSPRIREDFTGKLFTTVKALLVSPLSVRFYGLLCHYFYWNILHPWARNMINSGTGAGTGRSANKQGSPDTADREDLPDDDESVSPSVMSHLMLGTVGSIDSSLEGDDASLSSETSLGMADKESLFVQLEASLLQLHKKMGFSEIQLVTAHQSQVCACHFVVDELLTMAYPWINPAASEATRLACKVMDDASESTEAREVVQVSPLAKSTGLRVRRLLHQSMADIIDPSRIFTEHMLVASYVGTHKQLTPKASKAKYFATSMGVRAVFGDAISDKTRRFMMNSEEPYVPIPGVSRKVTNPNPNHNACTSQLPASASEAAMQRQSLPGSASGSSNGSLAFPCLLNSAGGGGRDKSAMEMSRGVYPAQAPKTVPPSSLYHPSKSLDFAPKAKPAAAAAATAANASYSLRADSAVARLARSLSVDILAQPYCSNEAQRQAQAEKADREERLRAERVLAHRRTEALPVDFYRLFEEEEEAGRGGVKSRGGGKGGKIVNTFGAETMAPRDDLRFLRRIQGPAASQDDDLRSMVDNRNAEVRVSIRAKSTLMSLVADRAASQYAHVASDPRTGLLLNPY